MASTAIRTNSREVVIPWHRVGFDPHGIVDTIETVWMAVHGTKLPKGR